MTPETNDKVSLGVTIEFSGTPFPARRKLLVHNAIEAMLRERTGIIVDGRFGLSEHFLPTSIHGSELLVLDYHEGISRVRELLYRGRPSSGPYIIQDGAFSALVFTEFLRRAGVFSNNEAQDHLIGLKPFVKKEDLIIINIIRPRAALSREIFPESLDSDAYQRRFIAYSLFNESLEKILHDFRSDLPQIIKVEPPGDDFAAIDIFFTNANIVFNYLGLPTTDEWDEYLTNHPEHNKSRLPSISGRSLAGMNSQEIIQAINDWDWSKRPRKRAMVKHMACQIINTVEEKGVIPPKK